MFKLIVKKEFSSAHILHGHPGDCKRMHGHNWLVEAKVEGDNINNIGTVSYTHLTLPTIYSV